MVGSGTGWTTEKILELLDTDRGGGGGGGGDEERGGGGRWDEEGGEEVEGSTCEPQTAAGLLDPVNMEDRRSARSLMLLLENSPDDTFWGFL